MPKHTFAHYHDDVRLFRGWGEGFATIITTSLILVWKVNMLTMQHHIHTTQTSFKSRLHVGNAANLWHQEWCALNGQEAFDQRGLNTTQVFGYKITLHMRWFYIFYFVHRYNLSTSLHHGMVENDLQVVHCETYLPFMSWIVRHKLLGLIYSVKVKKFPPEMYLTKKVVSLEKKESKRSHWCELRHRMLLNKPYCQMQKDPDWHDYVWISCIPIRNMAPCIVT